MSREDYTPRGRLRLERAPIRYAIRAGMREAQRYPNLTQDQLDHSTSAFIGLNGIVLGKKVDETKIARGYKRGYQHTNRQSGRKS